MRVVHRPHPHFEGYAFHCPGCKKNHYVSTRDELGGFTWSFNGDVDRPTFTPSVLSNWPVRCHSFVENGMLRFLSDSQHEFAGKTVEMAEIKEAK